MKCGDACKTELRDIIKYSRIKCPYHIILEKRLLAYRLLILASKQNGQRIQIFLLKGAK